MSVRRSQADVRIGADDAVGRARATLHESEERLKVAVEAAGLGTWHVDLPTGRIHWCARLARMLGLPPGRLDAAAEEWQALIYPYDRARVAAEYRAGVEGRTPYDTEFRIVRPDGEVRWLHSKGSVLRNPVGKPLRMVGVAQDITARKSVERRLEMEHGLLDAVVRHMPVGVLIAEAPSGRLIAANQEVERIFRHLVHYAESIDGYAAYRGFHPDGRPLAPSEWPLARSIVAGEAVQDEEIAFERGDGARGVLSARSAPVRNLDGTIIAAVMAFEDVTDRKRTEAQRDVLLRELQHRVKNMLTVALGLANETAVGRTSLDSFLEAYRGRVLALAEAYALTYGAGSDRADLRTVLRQLMGLHAGADRVRLHGPPVVVSADAAVKLSLVFHELATNAVRHGSLSVPAGAVRLSWRAVGKPGRSATLRFVWAEAGGPPVRRPAASGFGATLIERTVGYEFGGTAAATYRESGLRCRIDLPAEAVAP